MSTVVRGVVRAGKIELLEPIQLPEGANVLLTLLHDQDVDFCLAAGQPSLAEWNNSDDDVYGELLKADE